MEFITSEPEKIDFSKLSFPEVEKYLRELNDPRKLKIDYSFCDISDNQITFSVNKVEYKFLSSKMTAEDTYNETISKLASQLEFEFDCQHNPKKLNPWGDDEPVPLEEPKFGKKILEDIKSPFPVGSKKVALIADTYKSTSNKVKPLMTERGQSKEFKGIGKLQDNSLKREKFSGDCFVSTGFPSAVSTFHYAFLNHQHLALSPSDLIIMIGQGLATHINQNPEKLRHLFVDHQGKQALSVIDPKLSLDGKSDWSEVFGKFADEIKKIVKKNVHSVVIDDLSTATQTTRIVTEMTLMDCFKNYFAYDCGGGCGFPQITLKGTVDDWKKFQQKVEILNEMNKKNALDLDWWLKSLVPVVEKICEAGIDRNIDRKFWSNMCANAEEYGVRIQGWINAFLPYTYSRQSGHRKNHALKSGIQENFAFQHGVEPSDFSEGITKVPFTFTDEFLKKHGMHCYSGFLGTKYDEKNGWLEPAYFWSVYEDP